ncbi:acyltransferase domain-containing protein [Amycolatopsis sp. OK19-0408]|uniref:Acyltransferase domain-containing protein n=2 Tax=Amycolatopsis iheyensis TaxID=2945988 RepID=A0A9X2NJ05_9PSEU|nr:acyltransferase domain-containing protein [Amycolatopsis iheyensis]
MGRELLAASPEFREWVRRCQGLLDAYDCDWTLEEALGGANDLSRTDVVQPAAFVLMTGLAQLWARAGVAPEVVIGSSQGELAAACVAGVLSLDDALRICVVRSRLAAALPPTGGMLVLGVSRAQADELLPAYDGRLELAAVNGPAMVGFSGAVEAISQLEAYAAEHGIWCRRLRADYASHSYLVDELERPMLAELDGVGERPARGLVASCRFYSTVESRWIGPDEVLDAGYWFRNLRRPVELADAVRAVTDGMRAVVEVSPHPGLVSSVLDVIADAGRPVGVLGTLRRDHGGARQVLTALAEAFAIGLPVDWSAAVPADSAWRALCRDLPTHPFQHRRYWLRGGSGVAAEEAVHPLLTTVTVLPDDTGVLAIGRLSATDRPWLAGTVPASTWVELAIRAGDEVGCGTLAELDVVAPPRPGDVQVQVVVGADDGGRRPVRVRTGSDRSGWTLNATGVLSAEPLSWQPMSDDEKFEAVELPAELHEDGFGVHPVLLAAMAGDVVAWRDVELHATGATSARVRVRPVEGGVELTAVDESGLPVLTARRVTARPAAESRAAGTGEVLRTEWVSLDREATTARIVAVDSDDSVFSLVENPAALADAVAVFDVPFGAEPSVACRQALGVAQAWLDEPELSGFPLVVRTRHAVPVEAGAVLDPAAAAVRGMLAAVQAEYPDRFVLVDVEPAADPGDGLGTVLAAGAAQAAVRAGRVLVPRLVAGTATAAGLDPAGTVLIVGDGGDRVARYLVAEHGVRHLAFTGAVPEGLDASVTACDVSEVSALPPLTGVVHVAGTADATPLAELDADGLTEVLDARAATLGHLAELTAGQDLALFAVVTTAADLTGPADQAATAAADGLARAIATACGASVPVLVPGDESALTAALTERFPVPGHPERWAAPEPGRPVPPSLRGLVRPRRRSAYRAPAGTETTGRWAELLSTQVGAERERTVLDLVRAQLAGVLGLSPDEPVDPDRGFFEVGLDSLMALDLTRRLTGHASVPLTPAAVFTNPTPAALTRYLVERLEAGGTP